MFTFIKKIPISLTCFKLDFKNLPLILFSILIFLFPLFSLPQFPFTVNKIFLITIILYIITLVFLVNQYTGERKIFLPHKFIVFLFLLFVIIATISTYFSPARYFSFYGNLSLVTSLSSYILLVLVFYFSFLIFSLEENKKFPLIFLNIFNFSFIIFLVLTYISLFINLSLPFSFILSDKTSTLVIFLALGFLVNLFQFLNFSQLYQENSKKIFALKILNLVNILFSFLILFLLNFALLWLSYFLLFFFLVILSETVIGNQKHVKFYLFLMIIFFLLYIASPSISLVISPYAPNLPVDYRPNLSSTLDVVIKSIQHNFKTFLLGNGPATFQYHWLKYRPLEINFTPMWSLRFEQGFNFILTILPELGILGFAVILFLLVYLFLISFDIYKVHLNSIFLPLVIFLALLLFFFPANIVQLFYLSFFLGLVLAFYDKTSIIFLTANNKLKTYSKYLTLLFILLITTIFAYNIKTAYISIYYYSKGMSEFNKNNLDQAINFLNIAINLKGSFDLYSRDQSFLLFQKLNQVANSPNPDLQSIRSYIISSLRLANQSVTINPIEPLNYFHLATLQNNLTIIDSSLISLTEENYKKAIELDPYNPNYHAKLGIFYYQNNRKNEGENMLKKAYSLKPDDQNIINLLRQYSSIQQ